MEHGGRADARRRLGMRSEMRRDGVWTGTYSGTEVGGRCVLKVEQRLLKDVLMGQKGAAGGCAFPSDFPAGTRGPLQTGWTVIGSTPWGEEREHGVRQPGVEVTVSKGRQLAGVCVRCGVRWAAARDMGAPWAALSSAGAPRPSRCGKEFEDWAWGDSPRKELLQRSWEKLQ